MNKHKMRYSSSYSWHPTNIWNDDPRKKRKAYNNKYQ